jgi:hypothetical protein
MKNRIIEICELGQPQSIIHRENEPITELIKTEVLIKELNEAINYTRCSSDVVCGCYRPNIDNTTQPPKKK